MNLFWFRTDLRLNDNTALHYATQNGPTIALFIISPQQWHLHDDADCKVDFWLRQLQILSQQLEELNIPLLIQTCDLWDDLPSLMLKLCQQYAIQAVYCNKENGINEINRDLKTQQILEQQQITFYDYHDRSIFPLGSIKNKSGDYYKVFSAFKQLCYERLYAQEHYFQSYPKPKKQVLLDIQSHNIPLSVIGFNTVSPQIQQQWAVGETTAWQILDDFVDQKINAYLTDRDFPNIDGTSLIAAYLNTGMLSIRQCLQAARINTDGSFPSSNIGVNTWLDELLWREFYQHILYGFPQVSRSQPFKPETTKIAWRDSPDDLSAWQQGKTGFPIIDAAMRQLINTGWMHNRLRMIVAMFLSKNLLIDWRLGEQWFMQHLIDGDFAANNGGWQWCASTGTDSVPYFRVFNPITQSQKFDPQGHFIRKWLPELSHLDNKAIHEPYKYLRQGDLLDYPLPIVDLKQSRVRAIEAFQSIKI